MAPTATSLRCFGKGLISRWLMGRTWSACPRTPCREPVQNLHASGAIMENVDLASPEEIDLATVVSIEVAEHSGAWAKTLAARVSPMPEVMESLSSATIDQIPAESARA